MTVTIESVCETLNSLLELEPETMQSLLAFRVECGQAMAEHETVQVKDEGAGKYTVGILGLLNGVFGKDENGNGNLCAMYSNGKLAGFRRTPQITVVVEDLGHLNLKPLLFSDGAGGSFSNKYLVMYRDISLGIIQHDFAVYIGSKVAGKTGSKSVGRDYILMKDETKRFDSIHEAIVAAGHELQLDETQKD
jgi:hypothetical protein